MGNPFDLEAYFERVNWRGPKSPRPRDEAGAAFASNFLSISETELQRLCKLLPSLTSSIESFGAELR